MKYRASFCQFLEGNGLCVVTILDGKGAGYDASKEASNQQLCIRMCGSSFHLSLLSNTDMQSTAAGNSLCSKPRTNATK